MEFVHWSDHKISRFIIGGNPFSGFSHQSVEIDVEMRRYFTVDKIKTTLYSAENLGINTLVARADHHILRVLFEYFDDGGTINFFAQSCPEYASHSHSISRAALYGAKGCYIHGGVMDYLLAQGKLDEVKPAIDEIHDKGMLAGIAGHNPNVFVWAEEADLPVDFYMCAYYNPSNRDKNAEHTQGTVEYFLESDRKNMVSTIANLSKPVIHYKILAAGRNDPQKAFAFTECHMRPDDAVCVGVYPKHQPNMLRDDVDLFLSLLTH
jgi:hypothetical protein